MDLEGLTPVDGAVAYMFQNLDEFSKRRLKMITQGKVPSDFFAVQVQSMASRYGQISLEKRVDDFIPAFIDSVLCPVVDFCGIQLREKPEADVSVYLTFGQWWATPMTAAGLPKYEFQEVMGILRKGIDYHGDCVELYITIAGNYYQEIGNAVGKSEWSKIITLSRVGDYHLNEGLKLNPSFEPPSIKKMVELKDKRVKLAEEMLRQLGAS